jgi:hypothetical protein
MRMVLGVAWRHQAREKNSGDSRRRKGVKP